MQLWNIITEEIFAYSHAVGHFPFYFSCIVSIYMHKLLYEVTRSCKMLSTFSALYSQEL
jgi:hypothetical protein